MPDTLSDRILAWLAEHPTATAHDLVRAGLNCNTASVAAALCKLVSEQKVTRVARGRYALPGADTGQREHDLSTPQARAAAALLLARAGKRHAEIACALGLSTRHVGHILRGLGHKQPWGGYRPRAPQPAPVADPPCNEAPRRREQLVSEVQSLARERGVSLRDLWRAAGVLPPSETDAILRRLHLREVWREARRLPARGAGMNGVGHAIARGETSWLWSE